VHLLVGGTQLAAARASLPACDGSSLINYLLPFSLLLLCHFVILVGHYYLASQPFSQPVATDRRADAQNPVLPLSYNPQLDMSVRCQQQQQQQQQQLHSPPAAAAAARQRQNVIFRGS
jgi:hypothetical protein